MSSLGQVANRLAAGLVAHVLVVRPGIVSHLFELGQSCGRLGAGLPSRAWILGTDRVGVSRLSRHHLSLRRRAGVIRRIAHHRHGSVSTAGGAETSLFGCTWCCTRSTAPHMTPTQSPRRAAAASVPTTLKIRATVRSCPTGGRSCRVGAPITHCGPLVTAHRAPCSSPGPPVGHVALTDRPVSTMPSLHTIAMRGQAGGDLSDAMGGPVESAASARGLRRPQGARRRPLVHGASRDAEGYASPSRVLMRISEPRDLRPVRVSSW